MYEYLNMKIAYNLMFIFNSVKEFIKRRVQYKFECSIYRTNNRKIESGR